MPPAHDDVPGLSVELERPWLESPPQPVAGRNSVTMDLSVGR
jgi:hypothetical protein